MTFPHRWSCSSAVEDSSSLRVTEGDSRRTLGHFPSLPPEESPFKGLRP